MPSHSSSAAENIFLGHDYPTALGVKVRWRRLYDMARETLGRLGITHIDPRTTMAHLSPGDQMLVNIAHAFVGDDFTRAGERALIYVMDEPTAALTGAESAQLFDVIGRLRARGSAVLYVSHRMDEIFQIADRVTVLRDGQLAGTRDRASVTPAEIILLMTGREPTQLFSAAHGADRRGSRARRAGRDHRGRERHLVHCESGRNRGCDRAGGVGHGGAAAR
ncbi:MAG: sugar ABC transporter ATP-binding protein [Chloroflexi bacterium]|nr:sugar ABC transporter ATP-binding protein [Chloroflexota bacterium]